MFPNFPLFRHRRKPFEVTYTEGRSIDKVDAITNYHLDVLRKKNNWFVKYTILDAR